MKKILILFLILVNSCGYQTIYSDKNIKSSVFKKIIIEGEKDINKQLINATRLKEDNENAFLDELTLNSSYKIEETSKNSKGQVETYRSEIIVKFTTKNNNNVNKSKTFKQTFSYNNKNNKFELVNYQNNIKENLINSISEEIIFYLNLR